MIIAPPVVNAVWISTNRFAQHGSELATPPAARFRAGGPWKATPPWTAHGPVQTISLAGAVVVSIAALDALSPPPGALPQPPQRALTRSLMDDSSPPASLTGAATNPPAAAPAFSAARARRTAKASGCSVFHTRFSRHAEGSQPARTNAGMMTQPNKATAPKIAPVTA